MTDRCANCGLPAQLQEGSVPLCYLCAEAREAIAIVTAQSVYDTVSKTREGYRLALQDLKDATALLRDIGASHPDGVLSLQQANARFAKARDAYEEAVSALLARAREYRRRT